jgi:hypothetical protein
MNLLDDRKEAEAACEIAEANDCNGSKRDDLAGVAIPIPQTSLARYSLRQAPQGQALSLAADANWRNRRGFRKTPEG